MNDDQIARYARHILLPEVGGAGQQRLLTASVAVRGDHAGAQTAAQYLCAAGIGELRLSPDAVAAWVQELSAMNPDCHVVVDDDGQQTPSMVLSPSPTRLSGAMHAQRAVVALSGAAADFDAWTVDDRGGLAWLS